MDGSNRSTGNLAGPVSGSTAAAFATPNIGSKQGLLSLFSPKSTAVYSLCLAIVIYTVINFFRDTTPKGLKRIPRLISTLPYVGRFHDLDRFNPANTIRKFNEANNGLHCQVIGGETHIWIGRADIVFDLFCKNSAISSSRLDLGPFPGSAKGYRYQPFLGYTDHLIRQRKFTHGMMTRGIAQSFYGIITREMKRTFHSLLRNPDQCSNLVDTFCGRISATLAYGTPTSTQFHMDNAREFLTQFAPSGPVTNLIPFLAHWPEFIVPANKEVRLRQEKELKGWTELFETAKKAYAPDNMVANSYAGAYFEKSTNAAGSKGLLHDDEEAICAVGMLCTVAIYTIGGAIYYFVLAMVMHPEWREKVQAELDEVLVETDRLVELRDSPRLPILRATIKESLRWRPTVPLGAPRHLEKDYVYDSYHFPKDSILHAVDIMLARDPARYPDPETFNPGRWLDPEFPTYQEPLTEYPRIRGSHVFGSGKRVCPGMELTSSEMIMFCGSLLALFDVKAKLNEDGTARMPDPDQRVKVLIGGPKPFECEIKPRSERRRVFMERMLEEVEEEEKGLY